MLIEDPSVQILIKKKYSRLKANKLVHEKHQTFINMQANRPKNMQRATLEI